MPTTSYGAYNPNAVDPWPIEQTLAPLAVGGSQAEAQRMLGQYQEQRQAAGNVYGDELARQHEFNKEQLRQQLYEANLKGLAEAKDPTVLQLMAGNPMYSGVLGSNAANIGDALARAQTAAEAKNFQAGATGVNQLSQGGYETNPQAVPGVAGVPTGPYQGAAMVQAARIKAAVASAIAASRGAKEALTTVSGQSAPNAYGEVTTTSRRVKDSDVEAEQAKIEARNDAIRQRRATGGTPPASGGSGSSLPPNQQSTGGGGGGPPKPGPLDTNSPNGKMAQGGAIVMVDRDSQSSDPVAKQRAADIKAGMRSGGAYDTYMSPHGKPAVRGKSGNFYPINN